MMTAAAHHHWLVARSSQATVVCCAALLACGPVETAHEQPTSAPIDHVVDKRSPAPDYPDGPYAVAMNATLPNLTFDGVTEDGSLGTIALSDYFDQDDSGLLLIAVSGGQWCGTCRWPVLSPVLVIDDSLSSHVLRLDLVVGDRDNAPASAAAARAFQQAFEPMHGSPVGADPGHRLGALMGSFEGKLPLFVLVRRADMRVVDVLADPAPATLRARMHLALGDEADAANGAGDPETLVDEFFLPHEWALLQETTLPQAPPPDPTNAVADSVAAARLGRSLFFDARLSPNSTISCASCHRPDLQLADDLPTAVGMGNGDRRTPFIALSAHSRWQFWDGRADTLWAQALAPFEDENEYDASRVFVVRQVLEHHASAYLDAFPGAAIPDMSDWPASGKPGEVAYDALPAETQDAITEVFVRVGKAIAAWERTLRVEANPLDAYLQGDFDRLDEEQKYGLRLFVRTGCMQCHWGPRLTDDAFHNLRLPTGRVDGQADRGRIDGIAAWQDSAFRADGRWSDWPLAHRTQASPVANESLGKFKTPALRGVADRHAFGHGGAFDELVQMTESYGFGGVDPEDQSVAGTRELWLPTFGETEQWGLVPFLKVLTAEPILESARDPS